MRSAPGIHINDVNQGGIGDCYFMAALAALAKDNWQHAQSLVRDNGDGTFSARLFDHNDRNQNGITGWEWFTFGGNILANGYNMAELSGDFDGSFDGTGDFGAMTGRVEIWPNLLERAWAALKGGYGAIVGGNTAENAWLALTGAAGIEVDVVGWTNSQIRDRIIAERNGGMSCLANFRQSSCLMWIGRRRDRADVHRTLSSGARQRQKKRSDGHANR